jgi:hypothetical protein
MLHIFDTIKQILLRVYEFFMCYGKGDQVEVTKTTVTGSRPALRKGRRGYIIKPVWDRRKLWYYVDFNDTLRIVRATRLKRISRGWIFRLKLRFTPITSYEDKGSDLWKTKGFDN